MSVNTPDVTALTTHTHTNTTHRIMSDSKARLTSDLGGQRRHTVGDKWSTGPIVRTLSPSIYWLPKWSIMKWFTRSTAIPQEQALLTLAGVAVCPIQADICTNGPTIWFIRERTEVGPRRRSCFFKANRGVRKLLWMQDVTSGVRDKRYGWGYAEDEENMSLKPGTWKRRKREMYTVYIVFHLLLKWQKGLQQV